VLDDDESFDILQTIICTFFMQDFAVLQHFCGTTKNISDNET